MRVSSSLFFSSSQFEFGTYSLSFMVPGWRPIGGVQIKTTQWVHPLGSLVTACCARHTPRRNVQKEAKKSKVRHREPITLAKQLPGKETDGIIVASPRSAQAHVCWSDVEPPDGCGRPGAAPGILEGNCRLSGA